MVQGWWSGSSDKNACLAKPGKHETLSSSTSTIKKKKKRILSTGKLMRSGGMGDLSYRLFGVHITDQGGPLDSCYFQPNTNRTACQRELRKSSLVSVCVCLSVCLSV
jgi:hypothetical protein